MMRVGAHVSSAGGVHNAPANALAIGAKAFAIFTKSPRQWESPPLTKESVDAFAREMEKAGFEPRHVVPHAGYLINLGTPDSGGLPRAYAAFADEMKRCQQLGLLYLNIHPGAHPGDDDDAACMRRIADCVNRALDETQGVTVLLENTAGQGSAVGHTFEQIAALIDMVGDTSRVGMCLDTCHAFASGHDLRTKSAYEATMKTLDAVVGLRFLKAVHLNDSKGELGSRLDRHHNLGQGVLGLDAFKLIMNDPRLDELPMILETIDETQWKREIEMLYGFVKKRRPSSAPGRPRTRH